MSTANTQVAKTVAPTAERAIEFVPFGSDNKIKLSIKIVQDFICVPTKSNKICSERDAMKFMMLCQARSLNPWEGDAYLMGYDSQSGPEFSLVTAHVAFLKRAELHPEYDGMESGVVVLRDGADDPLDIPGDFFDNEREKVIGGWARVHFKNRKHPMYRRLRLSTFNKGFGVWKNNPEGMIVKCAEADALRSAFPTKIGGMYLAGEVQPGSDEAFSNAKAANATVESFPTGKLLKAQEEREAQAATVDTEPSAPPPKPWESLANLVESSGYDWPTFRVWAEGTGQMPDGANWQKWEDVPEANATRLLRAQKGLLTGLSDVKGK